MNIDIISNLSIVILLLIGTIFTLLAATNKYNTLKDDYITGLRITGVCFLILSLHTCKWILEERNINIPTILKIFLLVTLVFGGVWCLSISKKNNKDEYIISDNDKKIFLAISIILLVYLIFRIGNLYIIIESKRLSSVLSDERINKLFEETTGFPLTK